LIRALGAATVTAAAVLAVHVAGEAAQPVAESMTCSDVGKNLCPPEALSQSDTKDPDLQRPAIEGTHLEARPAGPDSLVPPTGNMTMPGDTPEVRMDVVDTTGMLAGTPLPLQAPSASVV
jgi:hypothetical protein